jgi:DNA-binding protein YbaB
MFNKLQQGKELLKMRQQAKEMEKMLAEVTETVEKGNVRVKVAANQKVEYIEIDGERNEELEKAINEAFKNVQKKAAQKMMEEGGGLSALLGGMGK